MAKWLVLILVAVWVLGLFRRRDKRLIKDSNHLLQLLLWVMLVLGGNAMAQDVALLQRHDSLHLLAILVWLGAAWWLSGLAVKLVVRLRG
jgi:hypothetical protein